MKKIIAASAGLMMVGVMMASSASAVESKFGGYWRTRMFTRIDIAGTDSGSDARVDTRTRLYYTAIFNENFKFVNKFEMDATWGGPSAGYGDVGADGVKVEVKSSYADFTMGAVNFKVGVQANNLARNILLDIGTDAATFKATIDAGSVKVPVYWVKIDEQSVKDDDEDLFAVAPIISAGEGVTVQPYLVYVNEEGEETDNYWVGADVNVKMDAASIFGTAIYNFGEKAGVDQAGYLVMAGASAGPVHGMFFYASGDDGTDATESTAFGDTGLMSYYWAEILGKGMIDYGNGNAASNEDKLTNQWAANVGFKVKPQDNLTIAGDLYYAELAEGTDTELGTEIDLKATITLMESLKLDLVAAYLIAGDAYGDEDPIEVGARLSLSF